MKATTQTQSLKPKTTIFKVVPEEKQQLAEEKDAVNIRKVHCKSFIQWFWELNLCCYKCWVDRFGSLRLFFCCSWSERLEINKTLDVRSLGKPVSFVFPQDLTVIKCIIYAGMKMHKSFVANLWNSDFWATEILHKLAYFISSTFLFAK